MKSIAFKKFQRKLKLFILSKKIYFRYLFSILVPIIIVCIVFKNELGLNNLYYKIKDTIFHEKEFQNVHLSNSNTLWSDIKENSERKITVESNGEIIPVFQNKLESYKKIKPSSNILVGHSQYYILYENIEQNISGIMAFDFSGKKKWELENISNGVKNIILNNDEEILFYGNGKGISSINQNGQFIYQNRCTNSSEINSLTLDKNNNVILTINTTQLVSCNSKTGEMLWIYGDVSQITNPLDLKDQRLTINKQLIQNVQDLNSKFPDWKYYSNLLLDNSLNENSLEDNTYLMIINTKELIDEGNLLPNCNDLRLIDSNSYENIEYWIQDGCNTNITQIYFKIKYIDPNSKKYIYILFGNSTSAQSVSSIDNVFYREVSDLVLYYDFENFQGNRIYDLSGYNHTGTINGTEVTQGKYGLGRKFIPRDVNVSPKDSIVIGYPPYDYEIKNVNFGDRTITTASRPFYGIWDNFSMEAWVKPDREIYISPETNQGTWDWQITLQNFVFYPEYGPTMYNVPTGQDSCWFTAGSDSPVAVGLSVGTNGVSVWWQTLCYRNTPLVYETEIKDWTHVMLVMKNRVPHLYINGEYIKSGLSTWHYTYPGHKIAYAYTLRDSGNESFYGSIDEVRIYKRWLEAYEVETLYDDFVYSFPNTPGMMLTGKYDVVSPSLENYTYQEVKTIINERNIMIVSNSSQPLTAYDLNNGGNIVWSNVNIKTSSNMISTISSKDTIVIGMTNSLFGIDTLTGTILWNTAVYSDDFIMNIIDDKSFLFFDNGDSITPPQIKIISTYDGSIIEVFELPKETNISDIMYLNNGKILFIDVNTGCLNIININDKSNVKYNTEIFNNSYISFTSNSDILVGSGENIYIYSQLIDKLEYNQAGNNFIFKLSSNLPVSNKVYLYVNNAELIEMNFKEFKDNRNIFYSDNIYLTKVEKIIIILIPDNLISGRYLNIQNVDNKLGKMYIFSDIPYTENNEIKIETKIDNINKESILDKIRRFLGI